MPFVVPDALALSSIPAAGWGDAAVIIPSILYQRYGDTGILAAPIADGSNRADAAARVDRRDRELSAGGWQRRDPAGAAQVHGWRGGHPRLTAKAGVTRLEWVSARRGGRAVECTGLENRRPRKGIEGSNPSLSASKTST